VLSVFPLVAATYFLAEIFISFRILCFSMTFIFSSWFTF
jgi:hypothetical protein